MHWSWLVRVSSWTELEYLLPLVKLKSSLLHVEKHCNSCLSLGGVEASSKPYLSLTWGGVRVVGGKDVGKVYEVVVGGVVVVVVIIACWGLMV